MIIIKGLLHKSRLITPQLIIPQRLISSTAQHDHPLVYMHPTIPEKTTQGSKRLFDWKFRIYSFETDWLYSAWTTQCASYPTPRKSRALLNLLKFRFLVNKVTIANPQPPPPLPHKEDAYWISVPILWRVDYFQSTIKIKYQNLSPTLLQCFTEVFLGLFWSFCRLLIGQDILILRAIKCKTCILWAQARPVPKDEYDSASNNLGGLSYNHHRHHFQLILCNSGNS